MADETKFTKVTEDIISKIEKLSIVDLNALVKALEEKFDVSASAPMAVATAPTAEVEPAEEKSSYDVVLSEMGGNKLSVIKAVREINPSLGLKEAKDLVEAAPKTVLEKVKPDVAEAAKTKLEEAGAKVELK